MSRTLPRQFDQCSAEDEFYTFYHKRQTSNVVGQSKCSQGGGEQARRGWLQAQIDKEIRLRAGAEKLLAVTTSVKLRDGICRELSLVNSNLQKMREELADQWISAQNHYDCSSLSFDSQTPMITLGLKETNDVDFQSSLKQVLAEHYHEDIAHYKPELNRLSEIRKASCMPTRSEDGVEKLFSYYNQLYFIDRRFFPSGNQGPVTFVWYDCLNGTSHAQNTIGFEKGCIMFNIAALYAQRGAKQMCDDTDSLQFAATDFRRAAGSFQYLLDNFCNAPSVDMQTDMMRLLVQIMIAQAQECELRRELIYHSDVQDSQELRALKLGVDDVQRNIELAQECAGVVSLYDEALSAMSVLTTSSPLPGHWIPVARCKRQYFSALAHWFIVQALGAATTSRGGDVKSFKLFNGVHVRVDMKVKTVYSDQLIHDADGRKILARAHLRQSILASEEALRIVRTQQPLCSFQQVLKRFHDKSMYNFSLLEEEDDFSELLLAPDICPKTKAPVEVITPDFSKFKVEDIFHRLGCIAIFSARHSWTPPRRVTMIKKTTKDEFGFSVRGDCPVIVATVDAGSLAEEVGMNVGDFIVDVGDEDVRWIKHDQVVAMIRSSVDTVILRVVTPTDHNYIDPSSPPAFGKIVLPPIPPHGVGGMPPLSPHQRMSSPLIKDATPLSIKSSPRDDDVRSKTKERTSSSFSWKLRKRRSHSKDKLGNERRNNASNHSYS